MDGSNNMGEEGEGAGEGEEDCDCSCSDAASDSKCSTCCRICTLLSRDGAFRHMAMWLGVLAVVAIWGFGDRKE